MEYSRNKKGFTMVDHITFDLVLPTLSLIAQAVFLRVYRQTVGWKRKSDRISLSQFRATIGCKHNRQVIRGIRELEERELIHVRRRGTIVNEYSIVWDTVLSFYDE